MVANCGRQLARNFRWIFKPLAMKRSRWGKGIIFFSVGSDRLVRAPCTDNAFNQSDNCS